jgi:hypothetical protein
MVKLRARLTDRLGGENTDRLADLYAFFRAPDHGRSIWRTDAVLGLAGQHAANLRMVTPFSQ